MPEFNLIPVARSSPTECWFCKTFEGPFVDTGVEKIEGHVIVCATATDDHGVIVRAGCVEQMARAAGCIDKEVHADTVRDMGWLRERVAELEQQIKDVPEANLEEIVQRLEKAAAKFESGRKTK